MKHHDVYDNDMSSVVISDSDVEELLEGLSPENSALATLTPMVTQFRAAYNFRPRPEDAALFGIEAARISDANRLTSPKSPASGTGWSTQSLRRRLVMPLAAAALLVAMTGVALAANGSAPGDVLFGLDQAMESVGLGDGGPAERAEEAGVLLEAGDVEGAVEHLAGSLGASASHDALLAVAERLKANGSENSADVHERVAAMLEWMATTDATGRDFGQGISERAKGLSDLVGVTPTDEVPVTDPGNGNQGLGENQGNAYGPGENGGGGNANGPGENSGQGNANGPGQNNGSGNANGQGKVKDKP